MELIFVGCEKRRASTIAQVRLLLCVVGNRSVRRTERTGSVCVTGGEPAWEQAECESNFVSDANVKGRTEILDAMHGLVTVSEVKMTLQLTINIWVPEGATEHVIEHEQGHRQIAEHYYQTADKVAEQIAAAYLGKQVSASGVDVNAEVNKLLQQMGAEIAAEYSKKLNPDLAQNRYDDITDHSRNDVSAAEAVTQVLKDVQ